MCHCQLLESRYKHLMIEKDGESGWLQNKNKATNSMKLKQIKLSSCGRDERQLDFKKSVTSVSNLKNLVK